MPAVAEIFGQDMAFHLRRLLVEPLGANLRNRMAHGMISSNDFFSTPVAYFWWIVLHLVSLPMIGVLGRGNREP
jgi:Domain of unknown function (DUF4209)